MAIDFALVRDVLDHADIVSVISSYIPVTRKGKNYVAVCPFHNDTNPSLQISKEKQIYKCFSCNAGGNAITFVKDYEHITFDQALRKVASLVGYTDPRLEANKFEKKQDEKLVPLYKCINDLCQYYEYALDSENGKEGADYFAFRKFDKKLIQRFHLGYAPREASNTIKYLESVGHSLKSIQDIGIAVESQNGEYIDTNFGRAIFPIADGNGQVVGFSARRINDKADTSKYINSPDGVLFHKTKILYNYHNAKKVARQVGYVYVLEGFADVFALYQIGIDSAVGLMGTALTKDHCFMLRQLNVEVRLCLDSDLPGQTAMMKCIKLLDQEKINYRIVDNHAYSKDADEILKTDGEQTLRAMLTNLVDKSDFALMYYQNTNSLKSLEDRKKVIKYFLPYLINITDSLEMDDYINKLSKATKFDVSTIRSLVTNAKKRIENQGSYSKSNIVNEEFEQISDSSSRKQNLAEKQFLYQMLNNIEAVSFYEENSDFFYNDVYRNIASYLVNYVKENNVLNIQDVISEMSSSDDEASEGMLKVISNLLMEKNQPPYSREALEETAEVINKERFAKFDKEFIAQAAAGKGAEERARIYRDYIEKKKKQ